MSDDSLLREAADPTTPSERLGAIFWSSDPWDMREEDFFSPRVRLYRALLVNPALPHSCVAAAMTVMPRATTYAAWLNPSLPLLLLCRPDLAQEDMARLTLTFAQALAPHEHRGRGHSFEGTVAHWHLQGPGQDADSGRAFVWQLARRLAFLFRMPWQDDDLLQEASDPTTSGERLHKLWSGLDPDHPAHSAVVRNPSLPLRILRKILLRDDVPQPTVEAWWNPQVPVLLREPLPVYKRAASQTLRCLMVRGTSGMRPGDDPGPLEPRIEALARRARSFPSWRLRGPDEPIGPHAEAARVLARHLAGLFRLPWPGEP